MLRNGTNQIMEMGKNLITENETEQSILVLSDSELLSNVIWANLQQSYLKVYHRNPTDNKISALPNNESSGNSKFDLIIVASSSPTTEPVVALAEAALGDQIGHTPLLIISNRNFTANHEKQIFHLDFPFDSGALHHKVLTLLRIFKK